MNPVSNEIDKHKLSQKISQSFKLSPDEALDLVNNTPIILLDNLTRPIASQIKDYFGTTHAELFLTNDVYVKRKCYRTVWPDPPSLSFLETLQPAERHRENVTENHPLAPDEALLELRSLRENSSQERVPFLPEASIPSTAPVHQDKRIKDMDQEVSKLKDLLRKTEQKFEAIQEEYRQARGLYESKVTTAQEEARKWKTRLDEGAQKSRKIEEDRLQLEKRLSEAALEVSVLREEQKRMTSEIESIRKKQDEERQIHEKSEKVQTILTQDKQSAFQELEESRRRVLKLEEGIRDRDASLYAAAEKLRQTEERLQELSLSLGEQTKFDGNWTEQLAQERALRAEETARLAEELLRYRLRAEDAEVALSAYERRISEGERALILRDAELISWRSDSERLAYEIDQLKQRLADEKILKDKLSEIEKTVFLRDEELSGWRSTSESLSHEIDKLRLMLGDEKISKDKLEISYLQMQEEKEALRASSNESQVRLQALQGELQSVRGQLEREKQSVQIWADQLRGEVLALREKSENLEKSRLRLVKEMEDAGRQADEWKLKAKDFEHAREDLEQKLAGQDEMLRTKNRFLEERERELEASRRQVRELVSQLEQRDMIHRRTQLTEQLSMKEDRLRQLIQEQNQLEGEMHQKEETMRAILVEQERIEKEIVEGKQAQRHYLEQVKREKQPVKTGRPLPSDLKKNSPSAVVSETESRPSAPEPGA